MILSGNPEGGRIYSKLLSANAVFKKARAVKHPSRNGGFLMTTRHWLDSAAASVTRESIFVTPAPSSVLFFLLLHAYMWIEEGDGGMACS